VIQPRGFSRRKHVGDKLVERDGIAFDNLETVALQRLEHEIVESQQRLLTIQSRAGVSIIWIEHVVHALLAVVDRLVVLHNGGFIAAGDPATVIKSPAAADIYMGIAADA
jgi:branched-chain amino acid transport system ATP-binding protein